VPGIVHYVEVQIPRGCKDLARCTIWHQEKQVWPTNRDGYFSGDGAFIRFNEAYEVTRGNLHFKVKGWNLDERHNHTIKVRIGLLKKEELFPLWQTFKAIQLFLKLFRRR